MVLQLRNVLLPLKKPDFKVFLRLPWDFWVFDDPASAAQFRQFRQWKDKTLNSKELQTSMAGVWGRGNLWHFELQFGRFGQFHRERKQVVLCARRFVCNNSKCWPLDCSTIRAHPGRILKHINSWLRFLNFAPDSWLGTHLQRLNLLGKWLKKVEGPVWPSLGFPFDLRRLPSSTNHSPRATNMTDNGLQALWKLGLWLTFRKGCNHVQHRHCSRPVACY